MKSIGVSDLGTIRNELNKYRKGKKLDIARFNQAARLAWLGRIVLCPLDSEDPACEAWLMHLQPVDDLARSILTLDEEDSTGQPFLSRIHILDAEQGRALAEIFEAGMRERVDRLRVLEQREFYLERFFRSGDKPAEG